MTRRFIRDGNGRFASTAGGGMVSGKRRPRPKPSGGSMTRTLRKTTEALKEGDRRMSLAMTGRAAGPILSRGRRSAKVTVQGGSLKQAMGGTLRKLAQSDARLYRGIDDAMGSRKLSGGKGGKGIGGKGRKRLKGS